MPGTTPTTQSSDARVNGLLWTDKWATSNLTFGFPDLSSQFTGYMVDDEPYNAFEQLDPVQQALVRTIFGWIASFTNLTFTEIESAQSGEADLRFGLSDAPATAWAYLPDVDPRGGDSWFNNSGGRFAEPVAGTYGYVGFIHEIGHALGLKHPHEPDGTGIVTPTEYDAMEFSIMSYHSYPGSDLNGYSNGVYSYAQSMMMLDIAALQHLYGANFTATAGDDVYSWNPDTGQFFIDGAGQTAPGFNRVFQTIWDGGGRDTYNFSNYSTSLSVDLRPGEWTLTSTAQLANLGDGHMARGNIANALLFQGDLRSLIEDVVGGTAGDTIVGNVADNMIDGGLGADSMSGGAGNDIYIVDNVGDSVTELAGEGNDEIRTGLAGLSLVGFAEVEKLTATSDIAHDFRGNGSNNVIAGAGGNDFLRLQDGGTDSVLGGGGSDVILFGATLTSADSVDGGSGTDQVAIQGDYSAGVTLGINFVGIESFAILPGFDTRFGDPGTNFYDYNLTTVEANVAAGVTMVVDANRLRVGEDFTFNGSAESDGAFFIYGGGGTDNFLGGSRNDTFYFGENLQFGATDRVDGGSGGIDQLGLRGSYTIVFGANQLTSIESIGLVSARDTRFGALGSSYNYNLTMNDGNVAAGVRMTVDAAPLRPSETFTFDGSAEVDGSFRIFGGQGADTIRGSQSNDLITGGLGADSLRGSGGNDSFIYRTVAESTSAARDTIHDFSSGDLINLAQIDANSSLGGNQAFSFIGSNAFSNTAGQLRTVFDAGNNVWTVQGDVNGDGIADIEFVVSSDHPMVGGDFAL